MLENIHESDFTKPLATLSQATIGQHVRHTLEFFICLEEGLKTGTVNYDLRNHDKLIESDRVIALGAIEKIKKFILNITENETLRFEVGYDALSDNIASMDTNFNRELTYNIEHAVHHMAILKIAIREAAPYISLPADFGVAVSTIKYKKEETAIPQ
ncbi:MAG: hypothetical protein HC811_00890 [Flammeovirgaceae bacterium]|nr:hypothetical protein [Flammeovirgaceae bacterium]